MVSNFLYGAKYAASAIILSILFQGCSKHDSDSLLNPNGNNTTSVTITSNTPADTKASMDKLKFSWLQSDNIGMFLGVPSAPLMHSYNSKFSVSSLNNGSAKFSGDISWPTPDATMYAVYPYNSKDANSAVPGAKHYNYENGTYKYKLPAQGQNHLPNGTIDPSSLSKCLPMLGKSADVVNYLQSISSQGISLSFEHICAVLDLNITNVPAAKTIYSIVLRGVNNADNKVFVNAAEFKFEDFAYVNPVMSDNISTSIINAPAGNLIVRMAIIPKNYSTTPVTLAADIFVKSGTSANPVYEVYTISLPNFSKNIQRGKRFTAAITLGGTPVAMPTYPGTTMPPVSIEGTIWAPVNCGYNTATYNYGKLYQWGRKDGFGCKGTILNGKYTDEGGIEITIDQSTATANIPATPDTKTYYRNWTITNAPNGTWGVSDPWKTKISTDPCPTGWRVPTGDELRALTSCEYASRLAENQISNNPDGLQGFYIGPGAETADVNNCITCIFIPASGRIHNGALGQIGKQGLLWASTPYTLGTNMENGNFYTTATVGSFARSAASSVRCVKE